MQNSLGQCTIMIGVSHKTDIQSCGGRNRVHTNTAKKLTISTVTSAKWLRKDSVESIEYQ